MREVRATPWNGYVAASLFAGCGGSSLGYRMAGFSMLYANEFVPAAADAYELNKAEWTIVDRRDVRAVGPGDLLERVAVAHGHMRSQLENVYAIPEWDGELDVLDGSPPCRSFSTAGKRERMWGRQKSYSEGIVQRDDDLFFEFARILRGVQPRAFVGENVSGLIKGVSKGYFKEIHAALSDCGYLVRARLVDAMWLGVPQQRQRVIFVGVRNDLAARGVRPTHPAPLPYWYSLRDALPQLAGLGVERSVGFAGRRTTRDVDLPSEAILAKRAVTLMPRGARARPLELDAPAPTVMQHGRRGPRSRSDGLPNEVAVIDGPTGYNVMLEGHAIAPEWDKLVPGRSSSRYFDLVRPDADRPSPTVTAANTRRGVAGVTHPTERRKFTIAELRRVCGFPDDFALAGTYPQQWERLGRAVPPPMMRAIAERVRDDVLARTDL